MTGDIGKWGDMEGRVAPRLRHLLVVVGPSGAGKSTFIDGFKAGAIPAAIAARLPDGAAAWPILPLSECRRWKLLASENDAAGIIFHVDTQRLFTSAESSAGAQRLLRIAEQVALVEIGGSARRIVSQYLQRSWANRSGRANDNTVTLATIESTFRDGAVPDEEVASLLRQAGGLAVSKIMFYRRADWPMLLDGHWRRVLADSGRDHVPPTKIEPGPPPGGVGIGWRLAPEFEAAVPG